MTGYAIHLGRERAVIACDTAVFVPDRPPRLVGFDTKLHPLAHLRAAIFGRGMSGIFTDVTGQLSMAPQLDTIERVAEALPDFLRAATLRYCRATGIGDPAGYGLVELFLVGWSEVERRMLAWFW